MSNKSHKLWRKLPSILGMLAGVGMLIALVWWTGFSKFTKVINKGGPVLLLLTLFYPFLVNLPQQAVSHDFMLLTAKADVSKVAQACISHPGNGYIDPQMMDEIIAHTGMAEGGETVTVTFTAPERSGNYTYICTFPCHFTLGMKGTLTVQ